MSRAPSVDVIVPCYNYGAYVEGCVASILDNPGVAVRVLLIDDASTDDTPEIGARLATADSRITYRRHHSNAGHIATYNEGLAWVTADYLLLISADDLLTSGALTRAVDALRRHPKAVFAYGGQVHFSDPAELVDVRGPSAAGAVAETSGEAFIASVCDDAQNPVTTPTVVVRADAHRIVGGYEPSLPHTADMELWLRLATKGTVLKLEALQALKRKHARNMQIGYIRPTEGDVLERRSAIDQFFSKEGLNVFASQTLLKRAYQALALELVWRSAAAFDARDAATANHLLSVARATSPAIRRTTAWRHMEIKRLIGAQVWAFVRGFGTLRQRST